MKDELIMSDQISDTFSLNSHRDSLFRIEDSVLPAAEKFLNPLPCYGGPPVFHISYISDIHLLHHMTPGTPLHSQMNATIQNLYNTMDENGVIIFGGDTSSSPELTIEFYTRFVKYRDYLSYKASKKSLLDAKARNTIINTEQQRLSNSIDSINRHISALTLKLRPHVDFGRIAQYKGRFYSDSPWRTAISAYKNVQSYKSKDVPCECDELLDIIGGHLDTLTRLEDEYHELRWDPKGEKQQILDFETVYGKTIEKLTISDVYTQHRILSDERRIFVVLGNHEYVGFNSVSEAVAFYEMRLTALGIKLLHNEYCEFAVHEKPCVIFGGTGFARYNLKYNAETLPGCAKFSRDDENKESDLCEESYKMAKQYALGKSCFICVSHYPPGDWTTSLDNDTIYFHGHNHQNLRCQNENATIFADNQIGYKNSIIEFKTMSTGVEVNPYMALEDGLHKTTVEDYLQFCNYTGEYIGEGTLLYRRCENNKADLFVIKSKGFYGFFIVNQNKGKARGISIVNGGKTKKLTRSTDLHWIHANFEIVLCKYLQILTPLRMYQEQISTELKELGFWGFIHGCIIDVDFFHHIMLDPVSGTMHFYYSPSYGIIQPLPSFDCVIKSICESDIGPFSTMSSYAKIQKRFDSLREKPNYLLGLTNGSNLLSTTNDATVLAKNEGMQSVSLTDGVYGVSRKVNPLQYLFSACILRDFDTRLIDLDSYSGPNLQVPAEKDSLIVSEG